MGSSHPFPGQERRWVARVCGYGMQVPLLASVLAQALLCATARGGSCLGGSSSKRWDGKGVATSPHMQVASARRAPRLQPAERTDVLVLRPLRGVTEPRATDLPAGQGSWLAQQGDPVCSLGTHRDGAVNAHGLRMGNHTDFSRFPIRCQVEDARPPLRPRLQRFG